MITFDKETKIFNLSTKNTSYVFGVYADKFLMHIYWGKKIREITSWKPAMTFQARTFSPVEEELYKINGSSCDNNTMEYPTYGSGDLRHPALNIRFFDGSTTTRLEYVSHKIIKGKPALCGLPATYVENDSEADTLELQMKDSLTGLTVFLSYTAFNEIDAITRSVRIVNNGTANMNISHILSASVDFEGKDFEFMHLEGTWLRERAVCRSKLYHGTQSIESRRGASSSAHNPFFALLSPNATETTGDVYGFNLVYSGNFIAGTEVDAFDVTRAFIGINPFNFNYLLEPGESFQAPEAVLVYSANGIGEMSRTYHKLYRTRLCRGKFRDIERYCLVNNWEGTGMDFTEEKILEIARTAANVGLDMLVLDDGWFGKRNNDFCALGDWYVNYDKLPSGIDGLAEKIEAMGLKFGLWFEPEMVSPDSDLYRAHPDWALHVNNRPLSLGRNQLMLDLSRSDVCEFVYHSVADILKTAKISYVKWDYNRNMSEIGSDLLPAERQGEVAHRYILGLYGILERLVNDFPNILFESCSSGGGRYDPGMLYYMPQTWVSDCTDAGERMALQYGTSIVYPCSSMGAHVSAVHKGAVRNISYKTRGDVATMGQFGYELVMSELSDEDIALTKLQIKRYKEYGEVFHKGDMYRINSPYEGEKSTFEFISEDKNTVILCHFVKTVHPNSAIYRIKLQGLENDADYVEIKNENEPTSTDLTYGGDYLMNIGLEQKDAGDYSTFIRVFRKK